MTQLNESDRQQMQTLAAQALVGDESAALKAAAAVDIGDIRDFFCKNWPEIKKVLQFIAENVGGIVRAAIRAVIAAGDFLQGRICRG